MESGGEGGGDLVAHVGEDVDVGDLAGAELFGEEGEADGAGLMGDGEGDGVGGEEFFEEGGEVLLDEAEEAAAVHGEEVVSLGGRGVADVVAGAAGGDAAVVEAVREGDAVGGEDAGGALAGAENGGGGAIAEEGAGIEVIPVEAAGAEFGGDDADVAPGAGVDAGGGDFEEFEEAVAGGVEVEARHAGGAAADLAVDEGGGRRHGLFGEDAGEEDGVEVGRFPGGGGEGLAEGGGGEAAGGVFGGGEVAGGDAVTGEGSARGEAQLSIQFLGADTPGGESRSGAEDRDGGGHTR